MNPATQQQLRADLLYFHQLTGTKPLDLTSLLTQILVIVLKQIRQVLLLYPVNVLVLVVGLLWLVWAVVSRLSQPRVRVYWPNPHIEDYAQQVKSFKKDIREVQNETLNFNRKLENKKNQERTASKPKNGVDELKDMRVQKVLEQRRNSKEIRRQYIAEIRKSEEIVMEKLKKYRRLAQ